MTPHDLGVIHLDNPSFSWLDDTVGLVVTWCTKAPSFINNKIPVASSLTNSRHYFRWESLSLPLVLLTFVFTPILLFLRTKSLFSPLESLLHYFNCGLSMQHQVFQMAPEWKQYHQTLRKFPSHQVFSSWLANRSLALHLIARTAWPGSTSSGGQTRPGWVSRWPGSWGCWRIGWSWK